MIGDFRHILTLQSRTRLDDGAGGFSESWTDVAADPLVYAAVRAVGGGEALRAGQRQSVTTYRITMRYRADVTADMRLTDGVHFYNIVAALDRDGRRQYLEVTATSEE